MERKDETIVEKVTKLFRKGKIEMTEEFEDTLCLMEETTRNIFITGKAGTGKSTLLKHFCATTSKKIVMLAPTGIAAVNIQGSTIHSFFLFPFGVVRRDDVEHLHHKAEIFNNLDAIVIDEISMVRADIMDAIDHSLRMNTGKNLPFGGIQIIAFGDLFQLPPVVIGQERQYFSDQYDGVYFFNANCFEEADFETVQLTKIFRQKDTSFQRLLNRTRERLLTYEDFELFNTRHRAYENDGVPAITLASTNAIADQINSTKLRAVSGVEQAFKATLKGDFREKDCPIDSNLKLKVGAQVMFVKNDSETPKRWVNGTIGVVKKLGEHYALVKIGKKSHHVQKAVWEIYDYQYNSQIKEVEKFEKGSFAQLPLKLAWAVTIHKSQGKTFEKAIIDLGNGAFTHGQTYVALSRCTKLEGIYLRNPLRQRDIIIDQKVLDFHKKDN